MNRVSNIVAYAHTHPNSNVFSGIDPDATNGDIPYANHFNVNAYVIGPNLSLQRYNVSDGTIDSIGTISPTAITDFQRAILILTSQISWDRHFVNGTCRFGCENMEWPTS